MRIAGKSGLITGAGSGIGRAMAVSLMQKGARQLTLCDIDEAGLEATAALLAGAQTKVVGRRLDVTDYAEYERVLRESDNDGGLDILMNNAGIVGGLPDFPQTPAARIAQLVSINLTAVIVGAGVAAQLMAARGGGAIVNTASISAFRPKLSDAPYRASKVGVVLFTQCCRELSEQGVRVNAIAPGVTDTSILDKLGDGITRPAWLEPVMQGIRMWTPEEMAAVAVALVEDDRKIGEVVELANEAADAA